MASQMAAQDTDIVNKVATLTCKEKAEAQTALSAPADLTDQIEQLGQLADSFYRRCWSVIWSQNDAQLQALGITPHDLKEISATRSTDLSTAEVDDGLQDGDLTDGMLNKSPWDTAQIRPNDTTALLTVIQITSAVSDPPSEPAELKSWSDSTTMSPTSSMAPNQPPQAMLDA